MQADFDDLRFTKSNGTTLIDAWLESKTDDTSAIVWVEFPTTPANTVTEDYYMYYGKVGVNDWNGAATFPDFFDDFSDGDYSSNPTWTVQSGSWSALSYYLNQGTTGWQSISTPASIAYGRLKYRMNAASDTNQIWYPYSSTNINSGSGYLIRLTTTHILLDRVLNGGISANIISNTWSCNSNWHTVEVTRDSSGNWEIFLDGVSKGTGLDNTYTTSSYIIARGNKINNGFDDILIGKYVTNPSTYAFGSEESAPSGNPYWYYNLLKRRN